MGNADNCCSRQLIFGFSCKFPESLRWCFLCPASKAFCCALCPSPPPPHIHTVRNLGGGGLPPSSNLSICLGSDPHRHSPWVVPGVCEQLSLVVSGALHDLSLLSASPGSRFHSLSTNHGLSCLFCYLLTLTVPVSRVKSLQDRKRKRQ